MDIQNLFNSEINKITDSPEKVGAFRKLSFKKDWSHFSVTDGRFYFNKQAGAGFNEKSNDVLVNKIKLLIKKNPWLFSFIYKLMNPSWSGVSPKKIIKNISGGVILNLGSGVTSVRPDVINIDFYPFENVDFVADIANLPFENNIADVVISECVLEHVPNPQAVILEMYRVMKPGAVIYVTVPFVFSFHSSPYDFHRWSRMGLCQDFIGFEEIKSGIHFGPGHAIGWVLSEYLSTILSLGFKKLHDLFFMLFLVILTPLSYLDIILNNIPTSENIASHVYFVGRKK